MQFETHWETKMQVWTKSATHSIDLARFARCGRSAIIPRDECAEVESESLTT